MTQDTKIPGEIEAPTIYSWAVEVQIETYLLGKVLTIIDASYSQSEQRDAVKSLIKEKFHSQLDHMLDRKGVNIGKSEAVRKAGNDEPELDK